MYTIHKRGACVLIASLFSASVALAHGPYPRSRSMDINAEGHMLLNTSFGLLRSMDDGRSWSWTCMESLGFDVDEEPTVFSAIRDDGSLHAASAFGLYSYEDCAWTRPPELGADYHTGLVRNPETDELWTVTSNATGQNFVYRSTDGRSWTPHGPALPDMSLVGLAVGTAESEAVFVSAIVPATDTESRRAVGLRLEGNMWKASPIADVQRPVFAEVLTHRMPQGTAIVIALVDPSLGAVSQTLISDDGGASWRELSDLNEQRVVDATWSSDGATLWIGGRGGTGIWQSTDGGQTLQQVNRDADASCLHERGGTLYVCGDQFGDGYMLGKSDDGGRSVEGISGFDDIEAEFECVRSTQVGATCQTPALDIQNDLQITLMPPSTPSEGCSCVVRTEKSRKYTILSSLLLLVWLTQRRCVTQ